jgi:hypothetical protein
MGFKMRGANILGRKVNVSVSVAGWFLIRLIGGRKKIELLGINHQAIVPIYKKTKKEK